MKGTENVFVKLSRLRGARDQLGVTLRQAKANLERAKFENDEVGTNKAQAFLKRVQYSFDEAELQVKTAELEISTIKRLAKGCTTPSGKKIRV